MKSAGGPFSSSPASDAQGPSAFFMKLLRSIARRYQAASLRFKIAFLVVVLITGTFFVFSLITVQIMNTHIRSEIIKRGEAVGQSIAASAGYNLLSKDLLGLDNLVHKATLSNDDMRYAAIVDPDMQTVVHSDTDLIGKIFPVSRGALVRQEADGTMVREWTDPSGDIFEIVCPVVFMKKPLGSVVIGMDKSILLAAQQRAGRMILLAFGIFTVLGTFASTLLAGFLIKPIRELSAGVERLKGGGAASPLRIYSQDELGRLTGSFNEMAALITRQQGKLTHYARDLEEAYVSMVKVVAAAIDARDAYTHGHSARVARLSLRIGRRLDLSEADLKDLEVACLLHDVGKIKTPDAILLKQGRLDQGEYEEMMQHVEYGASILGWAPSLAKYILPTRHHHEWHDGRGYPDGLSGEAIPFFAAIMSIADAFDAMTSDRPYRKALSKEEALRRIVLRSGTQFRPDLVAVFLEVMAVVRSAYPDLKVVKAAG